MTVDHPIDILRQVRVVMVNTTHPGNIGSAARAMKTMGLSQLILVKPKIFPSEEADWLASGAVDILQQARVVDSLEEAIADCGLVIGASARQRRIPWPVIDPRQCGELAVNEAAHHPVALVFGREAMGLRNEELTQCHYHVSIPGNPEYSVLNVAMAIQLLCYEVRMHWLAQTTEKSNERTMPIILTEWDEPLATPDEMHNFQKHFTQVLEQLEVLDTKNPRQILIRAKRFFARVRPDKTELNFLRGVLTAIQKKSMK